MDSKRGVLKSADGEKRAMISPSELYESNELIHAKNMDAVASVNDTRSSVGGAVSIRNSPSHSTFNSSSHNNSPRTSFQNPKTHSFDVLSSRGSLGSHHTDNSRTSYDASIGTGEMRESVGGAFEYEQDEEDDNPNISYLSYYRNFDPRGPSIDVVQAMEKQEKGKKKAGTPHDKPLQQQQEHRHKRRLRLSRKPKQQQQQQHQQVQTPPPPQNRQEPTTIEQAIELSEIMPSSSHSSASL